MQQTNAQKWRAAADCWNELSDDEVSRYLTEVTPGQHVSAGEAEERLTAFMASEEGAAALELLDAATITLSVVHFFQVSPFGAFRKSLMLDSGGFFYRCHVMVLEPGKELPRAHDIFHPLAPEEVEAVLCPYRTVHHIRAELNCIAHAAPS